MAASLAWRNPLPGLHTATGAFSQLVYPEKWPRPVGTDRTGTPSLLDRPEGSGFSGPPGPRNNAEENQFLIKMFSSKNHEGLSYDTGTKSLWKWPFFKKQQFA